MDSRFLLALRSLLFCLSPEFCQFSHLLHIFSRVVGFSGSFYFSASYFGLARDHGNPFLCLEKEEREG